MKVQAYFLQLLSRKDYSVAQLVEKGQQKGFEAEEILSAIAQLQDLGYQSDRRLTEQVITTGQGKYGKTVLKRKCFSKGIDSALFEELWDQLVPESDNQELDALKAKVQRKYHIEDFEQLDASTYRKVCQYLQYRGFHPRTVLESWRN